MAGKARRTTIQPDQADLFSLDPSRFVLHQLAARHWPANDEFPVNHSRGHVRDVVWGDLLTSPAPLVVAGFASIAQLVDLVADWQASGHDENARLLLGTEPFMTTRQRFGSPSAAFTEDVRQYWLEQQGISLRLSSKVVQVINVLDRGRLQVRFVPGAHRLHAKIFQGAEAATVGSSNFTDSGLSSQIEANARFTKRDEPKRYGDLRQIAENYWDQGQPWDGEFRDLLSSLLQFVPWQEALARACADLLEGEWASRYMGSESSAGPLWPSQRAGIAQAMWVVENVGSVLVADATGSGKTRMGAQMTRAVRDRLWSTGRVRGGLTVLVCPPPVEDTWIREAVSCGLTLNTVSHGLLSRKSADGPRVEEDAVRQAQVLAVDEAHNFLTATSNRTRHIRESNADHVLLFTATPINRGASDLLQLVDLLGADNFDDETLAILDQLERRGGSGEALTLAQSARLRTEIQRFTVRRTKSALNTMVDEDPESYRHPVTGLICRFPRHVSKIYPTGETEADAALATTIHGLAGDLLGVALLGRRIAVPATVRNETSDEQWLKNRQGAARGLAMHHVVSALRSSKAAVIEHVAGTVDAARRCGIEGSVKAQSTGDMLATVTALAEAGPPAIQLNCELPDWLSSDAAWAAACREEFARYQEILDAASELSTAREQVKAALLTDLSKAHPGVLAFDRHPITLAAIRPLIDAPGVPIVTATGGDTTSRKHVRKAFAPGGESPGIALCSDAMSEGLNLQGASAIVHLDLPTTLRVAEQRVGRVDRMDTRHVAIEAWWPDDGPAFATRANELLAARNAESSALLGSNLNVPQLGRTDEIIDVRRHISDLETPRDEEWDGIRDALDPVRRLVSGPDALVSAEIYQEHRRTHHRVLARVSTLESNQPWAFLAVSGTSRGAPRWLLLEGPEATPTLGIAAIADRLRVHLRDDPPSRSYDDVCEMWLDRFLTAATNAESLLLPRRLQRALDQMNELAKTWSRAAFQDGRDDVGTRWAQIAGLTTFEADEAQVDRYQVGEVWLRLVRPTLDLSRRSRRRARYSRLRDIDQILREHPLEVGDVERAFSDLTISEPLANRVTACIIGVSE